MCFTALNLKDNYFSLLHAVGNFPIPDLEIVGCPVMYKPNDNEYEVNFQWRASFSQALLSFIRHFSVTVFAKERGRDVALEHFSHVAEPVNVGDGSGRTGSCSVTQCICLTTR